MFKSEWNSQSHSRKFNQTSPPTTTHHPAPFSQIIVIALYFASPNNSLKFKTPPNFTPPAVLCKLIMWRARRVSNTPRGEGGLQQWAKFSAPPLLTHTGCWTISPKYLEFHSVLFCRDCFKHLFVFKIFFKSSWATKLFLLKNVPAPTYIAYEEKWMYKLNLKELSDNFCCSFNQVEIAKYIRMVSCAKLFFG